jgi:L-aminopeptidase/D-esterase-like protein
MPFKPGPRNLITDVTGLRVGNAHDERLKSGVTVILPDEPVVAGVQVLGGAPGTRETDALEPHNFLKAIHGIALSGGSAFGLDAASGVQALLRERGIGVDVYGHKVPVVPSAILLDLYNGGDKDWDRYPPYRELGYQAALGCAVEFEIGSAGAGFGATTAGLKGGLGSASTIMSNGVTVGALAAANPAGSPTVGQTRHFWAAPFEIADEFGGLGLPSPMPSEATDLHWKFGEPPRPGGNTTIAVVATDAILTKGEAKRMAVSAHDGIARAIWPAHTPADGDLVFAIATGTSGIELDMAGVMELAAVAASTMARAIARGVFAATPADGDRFPVWSTRKG